jgi:WD40 repeat protein
MKANENPFVGLNPIENKDRFFGREQEVRKLTELLIAERIVLLYSPSGAGKTSLLMAGLIPKLEKRKFTVHPVIRVGSTVEWADSASAIGRNRYLTSALNCLGVSPPGPGAADGEKDFSDYLGESSCGGNGLQAEVFIFDQFEEILTRDPFDADSKKDFFDQVGLALQDQRRWAVFAMREDYIAGLDPYLNYIPTHFTTTYRLNLLSRDAAIDAIQKTAEDAQEKAGLKNEDADSSQDHTSSGGSEPEPEYFFSYPAAEKLVDNLSEVRAPQAQVMAAGGGSSTTKVRGQYVEPVHLQIACQRLWKNLPDRTTEIKAQDIDDFGNVDTSLEDYYSEEVKRVADKTSGGEQRVIREWFDRQLITRQGLRTQVMLSDAATERLGTQTVYELINSYLVREDKRHDISWLELAHDRLITPVRSNNEKWFKNELSLLELRARAWDEEGRPSSLLFSGEEWEEARKWAEGKKLNERETAFYGECEKVADAEQLMERQERRIDKLKMSLLSVSVAAVLTVTAAAIAIVGASREKNSATAEKNAAVKEKDDARKVVEDARREKDDARKVVEDARKEKDDALSKVEDAREEMDDALRRKVEAEKRVKAANIALSIARADTKIANDKIAQAEKERGEAEEALTKANNDLTEAEENQKKAEKVVFNAQRKVARLDALANANRLSVEARSKLRHDPTDAVNSSLKAIDLLRPYASTDDAEAMQSLQMRLSELQQLLPATLLGATIPDCYPNKPNCKPSNIQSLGFSKDGLRLITASDNGKAYSYDLEGGNLQTPIPIDYPQEISCVAVSRETGQIAVGYFSGDVKIFDQVSRDTPLTAHRHPVHRLLFNADGSLLASASKFWTFSVSELKDPTSSALEPKQRRLYRKPNSLYWAWVLLIKGRTTRLINDFAFISKDDSPPLLMAAREDGKVEVREAISGKEVIITSLFLPHFAKNLLRLNPTQRDKEIIRRKIEVSGSVNKPGDVLLNIATSPNGNWLATAGKDGNIYVWNIQDLWKGRNPFLSLPVTLEGAGAVQSLAFNHESNLFASAGQDGSVRLWELTGSTWEALFDKDTPIIGHEGAINALTFNIDPRQKRLRLATADSKGVTKIWQLPSHEKLRGLQNLINKLDPNISASGDLSPLINEVRQYIGGLLAGR